MAIDKDDLEAAGPSVALAIYYGRLDHKLGVRELARRAGVPASQISRVESQEIQQPSSDFLYAIARALARPAEPLLYLARHITDEEYKELTRGQRAALENFHTAYDLVTAYTKEGQLDIAAFSAWNGVNLSHAAQNVLEPSALGADGGSAVLDLLAMWGGLTDERRRLVLSYMSDQERLSRIDRRGTEPQRFHARVEFDGL